MMRKLILGAVVLALTGLGLWLWGRNGLAVFVDVAVAFCT